MRSVKKSDFPQEVRLPYFMKLFRRIFIVFFVFLVLCGAVLFMLARGPYDRRVENVLWGVTFSIPYAEQLGLDWRETLTALLDELAVRHFRIPAYWQLIEQEEGRFDFESVDWQLDEIAKRNGTVILAVGRRLPRWPECHAPDWAKDLPEEQQREKILLMLKEVVTHYAGHPTVVAWQVDNEPFVFFFGECPEADEEFFAKEVALVRELDPTRPIVVSDSGELSFWFQAAKYADIFATTMYRVVPSLDKKSFTTHRLPPWFYNKKANLVNRFTPLKDVMVIELQAEAWAQLTQIQNLTIEEQYASMNPQFFRDTLAYVRRTGFDKVYLWGAEWWYWLKLRGETEIWDEAGKLLRQHSK